MSGTFWEICCYISNSSFHLPVYVWGGCDLINISFLKVHLLWSQNEVLKKAPPEWYNLKKKIIYFTFGPRGVLRKDFWNSLITLLWLLKWKTARDSYCAAENQYFSVVIIFLLYKRFMIHALSYSTLKRNQKSQCFSLTEGTHTMLSKILSICRFFLEMKAFKYVI